MKAEDWREGTVPVEERPSTEQIAKDNILRSAQMMLEDAYRGQKDISKRVRFLFTQFHLVAPALLAEACSRHIKDSKELKSGDTRGAFFPSVSAVQLHIDQILEEGELSHRQEAGRIGFGAGRESTVIPIEGEYLRKIVGRDFVEATKTPDGACPDCGAGGWVWFYILRREYRDNKRPCETVLMGKDWLTLYGTSQTEAALYMPMRCLCTCHHGRQMGEFRRHAPDLTKVKALARKTEERRRQAALSQDKSGYQERLTAMEDRA